MFLNYQDIAANYVPNNLVKEFDRICVPSKLDPVFGSKPYEEVNVEGKLIGYSWQYGDILNLEFHIDGEVTIEANALVYFSYNERPSETTRGFIGQRCYNVADFKSWTCSGAVSGRYYWIEDSEFTYPIDGIEHVFVSAEDYLRDKSIEIVLYNFRYEPILTRVFPGSGNVVLEIDADLSKSLKRGIYYCSVVAYNDTTRATIFDTDDCKLLVK